MGGEAGAGGTDNFMEPGTVTRSQQRQFDQITSRENPTGQQARAISNQTSRNLAITGPQGGATPDSAPQGVQQLAREQLQRTQDPVEQEGFLSRLSDAAPPWQYGLITSMATPLAPVAILGTAMNLLGAKPKYKDGTVVAPEESVNDGGTGQPRRIPQQQPTSRELATQATAAVQQQNGGTMQRSTSNGRLALGSSTGYRRSLLTPVYRRSV